MAARTSGPRPRLRYRNRAAQARARKLCAYGAARDRSTALSTFDGRHSFPACFQLQRHLPFNASLDTTARYEGCRRCWTRPRPPAGCGHRTRWRRRGVGDLAPRLLPHRPRVRAAFWSPTVGQADRAGRRRARERQTPSRSRASRAASPTQRGYERLTSPCALSARTRTIRQLGTAPPRIAWVSTTGIDAETAGYQVVGPEVACVQPVVPAAPE